MALYDINVLYYILVHLFKLVYEIFQNVTSHCISSNYINNANNINTISTFSMFNDAFITNNINIYIYEKIKITF